MDEENSKAEGNQMPPKTDTLENGVSLNKEQEEEGVSLHKEEAGEPAMVASEEMPVAEASYDFDDTSAPVPTPKKSNRNLIVGVVILVIIAAVGIIAGPKLMANPLSKVIAAFDKTAEEAFAIASPMEQASGTTAALKSMEEGKTSLGGQLSLVEAPASIDPDGTFSGLGLAYKLDTDMPEKMFHFDFGLMMDAAKLVNAEFYGNADTFDFAIPALVNGYFRVPLTNLGKAYKDSMFYEYQPIDVADDYSFSFFGETETANLSDAFKAVELKQLEWLKRLQKDLTATKTDQADMPVGEEMLPCQGYSVAMTDEKANAFLQEYITYWQTDADAQALIDEMIRASAVSSGYTNYMTLAETEKEMQEIMDEFLEMSHDVKLSNITFDCYIDKKGIVRKFVFAEEISTDGDPLSIIFEGNLAGAGRAVDDLNMALNVAAGEDAISLKFQNRQYQDGENVVTEGTFLGGDQNEDSLNSQWNMTYNTKNSEYSVDADLRLSETDEFALTSKGLLEIPEKGKSFHLSMDSIDFSVLENGSTERLRLKGLLNLDQLTEAVKQPSGTEHMFFELDQAGLQAIIFEAYGNLMRLGNELSGVFN